MCNFVNTRLPDIRATRTYRGPNGQLPQTRQPPAPRCFRLFPGSGGRRAAGIGNQSYASVPSQRNRVLLPPHCQNKYDCASNSVSVSRCRRRGACSPFKSLFPEPRLHLQKRKKEKLLEKTCYGWMVRCFGSDLRNFRREPL